MYFNILSNLVNRVVLDSFIPKSMCSYSFTLLKRIIDKSIEHHQMIGQIFDDRKKKLEKYTGKNSQDNNIVIECLTAIEDVLLFSISNYFTKFSERYKYLKK